VTAKLKLAYIFDQILPAATAESEQLINTISALSLCDFDITLFMPASNEEATTSVDELKAFYHVDGDFSVEHIHSLFPGPRVLQKVLHPTLCTTLLRKKLRNFDLVYSRNIPAVAAALAMGLPVVYDTYRPWPIQYHRAFVPLFKRFFANPRFLGIATHSEFSRQSYLGMGAASDRVITAYNGYNPALFDSDCTAKQARQKLGLAKDKLTAIYAGRMDPEKGVDSLIDLAEASPNAHFVFLGSRGDGPLERRLATLPNVTLRGWVKFDELPQYLCAADILLLPLTPREIKKNSNTVLPIKIYSYFGAKRAIFAPIADDTAEILNEQNACLVPQGDAEAAIKKFHELIETPAKIKALSDASAQCAKRLTWEARGRLLSEFIRQRFDSL
jgi:glycosyltransferase involved in cell wall biosynthesis